MTIPLYQGHDAPTQLPAEDSHRGLWYTRFFNRYSEQWTLEETANATMDKECDTGKMWK
jgi:hypothetical protein